MVKASPQQTAIYHEVADGERNVVVNAVAGSGKTTTLEAIVKQINDVDPSKRILATAFNTAIRDTLQRRIGPRQNVSIFTLHQLGLRACGQEWRSFIDNRDRKLYKLLDERLGEDDSHETARRLVMLAKANLAENREDIETLADRYGVNLNGDGERVLDAVLGTLDTAALWTNLVDFNDMIWLPVRRNVPLEQYDVILGDEAQDFDKAQQQLLLRSCKKGRLIIVGDRFQACYGFRGADTESMDRMVAFLKARDRGVVEMPLSVTWRCPTAVVDLAKQIVPEFTAAPGAKPGTVETLGPDKAFAAMREGDLVMCRTNAPLMSVAYDLIVRDTPVKIQGRDIGRNLATFIRKSKAKTLDALMEYMEAYEAAETEKMRGAGRSGTAIQAVTDRVECVFALCEGQSTVEGVLKRIEDLFADVDESGAKRKVVLLSSIHRAKGLEADHAFILRPDLLPHPMAKQPWEAVQERNLKYIAETRALDTLTFIGAA